MKQAKHHQYRTMAPALVISAACSFGQARKDNSAPARPGVSRAGQSQTTEETTANEGMALIFLGVRFSEALLVIAALILGGCSWGQLKGGPGSSSATGKDNTSRHTTSFSPSSDARKDLGDALRKLKTAYPYRLTETTSSTVDGQTTGPTHMRVAELAAPDRSHIKLSGGSAGDVEMIHIGDQQYWYSNGKWSQNADQSAEEKAKRGADLEKKLAEAAKEVKYLGPETANGVPSFAYTFSLEMIVQGQTWAGTGKAWVGAADGLPHQIDSEFQVGKYGQKSHIVYEYNVDVKVEKPGGIK